jgi:endonuclease VIII
MPEGDTIFRTARTLDRALAGKPVTAFRSTYPLLMRFDDETPLAGQSVESVEARGKWLLMHFSGGGILVTHMLMNGSWHIYRHGERWQQPNANMRIVIENSDYVAVGFRVPVAEMHTAESLRRNHKIPTADRDVLRPDFNAAAACTRMATHENEEIGDVLMNQRVLAGVGNVFKSEICFVTGVNPFCRVDALAENQLQALVTAAQHLISSNILDDSGDVIVTYGGRRRRTTHESDASASLWVYGRQGKPCRKCGEKIQLRLQGRNARLTYWCPYCQPMPDGSEVDG